MNGVNTLQAAVAEMQKAAAELRGDGAYSCCAITYEHCAGLVLGAAPQPPSGGGVRAKPLEWQEDGHGEWCDRHHGFHITQDDEEPKENRFTAAWGEGDPEWFPTLQEAQAWCQEAIDRYIREWADTAPPSAPDRMAIKMLVDSGYVPEAKANEALNIAHGFDKGPLTPPSAPVGVESVERALLTYERGREAGGTPFHAMQAALAQQPAALDIGQFRPAVATHHLAARKRVRDCRAGLLPAMNLSIYERELAEADRLLDLVDAADASPIAAQPGGSDNG